MNSNAESITGKRILLVEDERAVRDTIRLLLSKDLHTVVEANNGAEAFALFATGKFDLVMTDFEMPFVKGDELAMKIRRVAPDQPILMLTAFEHQANRANPVDIVVKKPFDCASLRATMSRLISRNEQSAETSDSLSLDDLTEKDALCV